jgi:hypothetical protein
MRDALNATGRPIYYSIHGPSGADAVELANCWRTTHDINNSYASMLQRAVLNDAFATVASPGAFNDPDMLEVCVCVWLSGLLSMAVISQITSALLRAHTLFHIHAHTH